MKAKRGMQRSIDKLPVSERTNSVSIGQRLDASMPAAAVPSFHALCSTATNGDKRATLGSKEIAEEEEEQEGKGHGRGGCHVVVTAHARRSLEIDTAD
ncbi:hypothetical protein AWZ03_004145 [Drosophila navojoa]|uniref:Uncharacterized protein n=1 Tax=Drosophila navojoa TaxID=7232 RepID=A0A484BMN8_DRONA|nr:hypothetical protein AWZ03_004145 [Drosophila navojoa]